MLLEDAASSSPADSYPEKRSFPSLRSREDKELYISRVEQAISNFSTGSRRIFSLNDPQ